MQNDSSIVTCFNDGFINGSYQRYINFLFQDHPILVGKGRKVAIKPGIQTLILKTIEMRPMSLQKAMFSLTLCTDDTTQDFAPIIRSYVVQIHNGQPDVEFIKLINFMIMAFGYKRKGLPPDRAMQRAYESFSKYQGQSFYAVIKLKRELVIRNSRPIGSADPLAYEFIPSEAYETRYAPVIDSIRSLARPYRYTDIDMYSLILPLSEGDKAIIKQYGSKNQI